MCRGLGGVVSASCCVVPLSLFPKTCHAVDRDDDDDDDRRHCLVSSMFVLVITKLTELVHNNLKQSEAV